MSRRLRLLLAVLALVLLAAGGVAAAWPGTDWLKPRIEAAVQRATGRALGIDGPLRIGWNLTLDASGVTLANMPGGSRPAMARVGRIHARLALLPLLRRQVRVTDLELVDPQILVERDAAGVVNWRLLKPAAPGSPSGPASGTVASPWSFVLDRLNTTGGSLAWHDALHAAADGQLPLPAIQADLTGALPMPRPVPQGVLAWRSGPLPALGGTAAPVQAAISLAGATASLSGTLAPGAAGLDATIGGSVADAAGQYGLTGHLVATPQRIAMDAMHLATPAGDLAGDLAWTPGARPLLVANLAAQRLDLAALCAMLAALRPRPAAAHPVAAIAAVPVPVAPHIISDRPLPLAGLDRLDADVRLRVATLANPDLRDIVLHLLLHDGRLALDPFTANAGGQVDGSLQIDTRQPVPTAAIILHAPSLALGLLLQAMGLPRVAGGTVALDADLHSAGRTPHELAATLTGTAHVASADATLDATAAAGLLRAAHLPPLGSGAVPLRCLVVGFESVGGKVTVAPLLLESGRLAVQGDGRVDLDAETLAMQLRPMLRTGPGLVIPLRITGGWRMPTVSSDLGAILGTGGSETCAAASQPSAPLATPEKHKPPKPIDILRGLLR